MFGMTDWCKCRNCGEVFHVNDVRIVEESRGEFWGAPAYEKVGTCPYCWDDDIEWDYYPDEEEEEYEEIGA